MLKLETPLPYSFLIDSLYIYIDYIHIYYASVVLCPS